MVLHHLSSFVICALLLLLFLPHCALQPTDADADGEATEITLSDSVSGTSADASSDSCFLEQDVDFVGHNVGRFSRHVSSAAECCEICSMEPDCKFFSWSRPAKRCYRKYSKDGRRVFRGSVSGWPLAQKQRSTQSSQVSEPQTIDPGAPCCDCLTDLVPRIAGIYTSTDPSGAPSAVPFTRCKRPPCSLTPMVVLMTSATFDIYQMLLSWACQVRSFGMKFFVHSQDLALHQFLAQNQTDIPSYYCDKLAIGSNAFTFGQTGYSLATVMRLDVDVFFFSDPWRNLFRHSLPCDLLYQAAYLPITEPSVEFEGGCAGFYFLRSTHHSVRLMQKTISRSLWLSRNGTLLYDQQAWWETLVHWFQTGIATWNTPTLAKPKASFSFCPLEVAYAPTGNFGLQPSFWHRVRDRKISPVVLHFNYLFRQIYKIQAMQDLQLWLLDQRDNRTCIPYQGMRPVMSMICYVYTVPQHDPNIFAKCFELSEEKPDGRIMFGTAMCKKVDGFVVTDIKYKRKLDFLKFPKFPKD